MKIQIPKASFRLNESDNLRSLLDDSYFSGASAETLNIGDSVIIKKTSHRGQEGTIESFSTNKKMVVVKLKTGSTAFHSSDVAAMTSTLKKDDKFYVAFYDPSRETSWIGKVSREGGGMWHEKSQQGTPSIEWDGSYEKYLTPEDIVKAYKQKVMDILKVEGPFSSLSLAIKFVDHNWGDIKETTPVKESLDIFFVNALKVLNTALSKINSDQSKDIPSITVSIAFDMKKMYRRLYAALVAGDEKDFIKNWDSYAEVNGVAFNTFAGLIFKAAGVKDFPAMVKKLTGTLKESLNKDGYHSVLKNPQFLQNPTLVVHGDPRLYLHDESDFDTKHTKHMIVTYNKKHMADECAEKVNGNVVTTPAGTFRIVKKRSVVEEVACEKTFTDFNSWKNAVKDAYPKVADKLKFVGRLEAGEQTISAGIPNEDRCYGVWYVKKDEGCILSENINEITFFDILTEADLAVSALGLATTMLGTKDVKKVDVDSELLSKAREFNQRAIHSADGERWYISLFQLADGKRFARILPSTGSKYKQYFIEPNGDKK